MAEVTERYKHEPVRQLIQLTADKFGFEISENRLNLLTNILNERTQQTGFHSQQDYVSELIHGEWHSEWNLIIDQLTIKQTYFFRNESQFEYLENVIIPEWVQKYSGKTLVLPKIRILSAGCSTGEEPYSIAMSVADKIRHRNNWDIRIDAIDISYRAIETAQKGVYRRSQRFEENLRQKDPSYLEKFFDTVVESDFQVFRIKNDIRKLVHFSNVNLKVMFEVSPVLLRRYDVIFCRNVMIYFGLDDQIRLVELLERSVEPQGYIMMGDAECLHRYSHHLQLIDSGSGLIYKKSPCNS